MNNDGLYGKIIDISGYFPEEKRAEKSEKVGCLAMALMVLALGAGFSAALLSMLAAI